ncbi:hypothetical protein HG536_0A06310 [Torulaspora globosa]|uniref:Uncharacterized protein n=1 Tax=Torulaspora globosa TaxID=48254 RepID=A0A7G3ZBD0_9SACH|nr:uncharacterized protein HG536_0A06310 [Torulaspora globosa]QLL30816.1 hypothetical protein HG536_0A06310 [Torulaspora globosa]
MLEDGSVPQNVYKNVRIYPDSRLMSSKEANGCLTKGDWPEKVFKPCVSFNTVPSYMDNKDEEDGLDFPGVQMPPEYTMEEFYDDESGFSSSNAEYFLRNHYVANGSSYGGSPPPRNLGKGLASMFRVAQNGKIVRVDYPTTPTIMNDAIVINRAQPGWEKLWYERKRQIERRLNAKQTYFRYPDIIFKQQQAPRLRFMSEDGYTPLTKNERRRERILNEKVGFPNTPRTILCHISGRRHTWVALDWTMRRLAQNTDHIVVLANIPRFANSSAGSGNSCHHSQARSGRGNQRSSLSGDIKDPRNAEEYNDDVEWTSGYGADAISNKLEDLFDYIAVIIPKDITVRVTVEIVIGKTKKIILDAMNVYTPEFCTSTTLRWERTDKLVQWKSKNLSDVLCTKYPIPVFVIPVKRMYDLEQELQEEFPPKASHLSYDSLQIAQSQSPPSAGKLEDSKSQVGQSPILLIETADSESSSDFSDSITDTSSIRSISKSNLIAAAKKHREDISRSLKEFENQKHDSKVTKLLEKLDLILKSSLDFSLQVQNMTQNDSEAGFEKLKRVITGETSSVSASKKSMLDVADAPKRNVYKNVPDSRPRNSQIKFASDVTSKDGRRALGNKAKPTSADVSPPLRRSISPLELERPPRRSHDEPLRRMKSAQSSNTIRKVRSASNISRVKSNDSVASDSSSSSKKKGGFLSIFKGSGSRSRSTSRHNSIGSDNETISSSDGDSKKRRSRLFGFS